MFPAPVARFVSFYNADKTANTDAYLVNKTTIKRCLNKNSVEDLKILNMQFYSPI